MKRLLIVLALLFAMPAFADDLEEYVKLLKTDLKAQARDIISKGMQTFTDEEAKRFWPIYESYMAERDKFLEARVAVIKAYADDYDTMTDESARTGPRRFGNEAQASLMRNTARNSRRLFHPGGSFVSTRFSTN